MKNTSLKLLVLALVGLFLTNCQRDDAPEVLPQEEPVPTVDPQVVVSLDEAKTLFDATEKQKSMINATSRSKQPLIQLETNWRYFEQMQTLTGDAYAKIPITIIGADWDTECSTEMIFVKKNNVAKQYLFVTEVDSLTNDNRIVNADFYLLTSKGEFISAYRMENGIITNELIPKYKRNYRLVVNAELDRMSRKPKKRNNFTLSMFSNWSTENDSEGDDDCGDGAPWGSGGSGTEQDPFQLNPVTLVGERKNQINNSYTPYPTYTPYTPNNNGFPDPDKLDREMPRGGGGGGGANSSSNLAYDMIDADGNKVEVPIIYRPDHPISDNKCFFSTVDLNKGATLTIYVDEPNPGTGNVKKWINVGHTFIGITQGENQYTYGFYPNVPGYRTIGNNDVSSVLGKDDGHTFSVSFSTEVTPEQLQKIIELSQKSYARQYNLSYSNCTDFAISVANLANITLPYCKGTWTGGGGSAPGVLGKALRDSSAFKNKINTRGGKAPASKGNGC
ncbi:hypothetical protein [Capnocytophaga sputigena]|uniref:hypothetical protein n=1 Tax=Capnocytophaga sputigena TaxID=1019 RepID=UPI0028E30E5C|nr:hypothetical protein [Capnocytophaga sputigena]